MKFVSLKGGKTRSDRILGNVKEWRQGRRQAGKWGSKMKENKARMEAGRWGRGEAGRWGSREKRKPLLTYLLAGKWGSGKVGKQGREEARKWGKAETGKKVSGGVGKQASREVGRR